MRRQANALLLVAQRRREREPRVASPNCCKSPKSRQGNGVGSPKSCKTKKGDLRREKNRTAVGGDRSPDRPAARRRSRREPALLALGAGEARRAPDHPARGRGRVRRLAREGPL